MKKSLLLISLMICGTLAFAQQIPSYIPTDSLVAWYPFNDNANDESGNGHNGVANYSTILTTDRCEIPNSAYYFNGQTSQITISDSLFNGGWNGHTICCWFNSDTLLNPYNYENNQTMINTLPHRGEEISFNYGGDGHYNFFVGSDPPAAVWDILPVAPSQSNVSAHSWNHIAIVKDGTSYSLYINGTLDTVFQTNIIAINYYCSLVIGNISEYAIETFFGKLDDFGIWKRALSAAEILEIYNAGCLPLPNFSSNLTSICEKFCVDFTDSSANNPTAWQWVFDGGNPSSSTDQNPTNICYSVPGTYDVTLITTNASGNDTISLNDYITVNPTPPFPTITQVNYTLTSSQASAYQWQFNSTDIPGATNQSYTFVQSGYYTVIVSDSNGCQNSASVKVFVSGIEDVTDDANISIYPNPATNYFTIALGSNTKKVEVTITDITGKIIYIPIAIGMAETPMIQVNTDDFTDGVYVVRIQTPDFIETKKIIVVK